jgi:hypothetical protein
MFGARKMLIVGVSPAPNKERIYKKGEVRFMSNVAGYLWDEAAIPPVFCGSRWVKGKKPWSLRTFPMTPLSYRLPIEYQGGVSQAEVDRYHLQRGDYITRSSGFCSMPIATINGFLADEWARQWPAGTPIWSDLRNEPNRFLSFLPGSDPMVLLLEALLPQQEGFMVLCAGGPASRKSDLTKAILWSLDPSRYLIKYVFLERSNEEPRKSNPDAEEVNQKVVLPPWAELWSFPFELQNDETELVDFVNLARETSQRQVFAGKHVIVLVDSLEVFAKAVNTAAPDDGRTMSGGLVRPAMTAVRTWISSAKRPPEPGLGSLSIVGLFRTNDDDRGTASWFSEIKGVSQGHIIMRGKNDVPCNVFPINIRDSQARMIEAVRGPERAQHVWNFLNTTRGREVQIYNNTIGSDRTVTTEQKIGANLRVGEQLGPFYKRLMDNCVRAGSLDEIWDHWVGVMDGTYPPPDPVFGPKESTTTPAAKETKTPAPATPKPAQTPETPPRIDSKKLDDEAAAMANSLGLKLNPNTAVPDPPPEPYVVKDVSETALSAALQGRPDNGARGNFRTTKRPMH